MVKKIKISLIISLLNNLKVSFFTTSFLLWQVFLLISPKLVDANFQDVYLQKYIGHGKYYVDATLYPESQTIKGSLKITFENISGDWLDTIYLVSYANLYRYTRSEVTLSIYDEVYPGGFQSGYTQIRNLRNSGGQALKPGQLPQPLIGKLDLPEGTVAAFKLPKAIEPFASYEIRLDFETFIPQKFGVFGYFNNYFVVQGGWFPLLVNIDSGYGTLTFPEAELNGKIQAAEDFQFLPSENSSLSFLNQKGQYFGFIAGKKFNYLDFETQGLSFEIAYFSGDEEYIQKISDLLQCSTDFFVQKHGLPKKSHYVLTEVFLDRDLAVNSDELIFFSEKSFKIFFLLQRFQDYQLVYNLYYQFISNFAEEKIPDWVAEGLAHQETETFLIERYCSLPSLSQLLGPVGFIPVFYQILYSRDLPFRSAYFEDWEKNRPLPENIAKIFSRRPPGRIIFMKLVDLLGKETVAKIQNLFLEELRGNPQTNPDFVKLCQQETNLDLEWFFVQWLLLNPSVDYSINSLKSLKKEGFYLTEISLSKRGLARGPISIDLDLKEDQKQSVYWEGLNLDETIEVKTPKKVIKASIDPAHGLWDNNPGNNIYPRPWQFLVHNFSFDYDFQSHEIQYEFSLSAAQKFDFSNRFTGNFFHKEESDGFNLEYTRAFRGSILAGSGKSHLLTGALGFENLSSSFSENLDSNKYINSISFSYNFNTVSQPRDPSSGVSHTISLIHSDRIFNGDFRYDQVIIDLRKYFRIQWRQLLAARIFTGLSWGEIPEHKKFFLGGFYSMKAYSKEDFKGDKIVLSSLEYRYKIGPLWSKNFWGLALLDRMQGMVYLDAGQTKDHWHDFDQNDIKLDLGIGLGFYYRLAGLLPGLWRIDACIPIKDSSDFSNVSFYTSAAHSF